MNFSKGPSLSPLPVVFGMREKLPLSVCFSLVWGFFFVGITSWVGRRGGGRPPCSWEKLFEEQKRIKRVILSRHVPHQALCPSPILRPHGLGDFLFFPDISPDCAVMSDGYSFWKGRPDYRAEGEGFPTAGSSQKSLQRALKRLKVLGGKHLGAGCGNCR